LTAAAAGSNRAPERDPRDNADRRMMMAVGSLALLLAVAASCEGPGEAGSSAVPPVAFDSAFVRIESGSDVIGVDVEVAETAEQRAHGLMERTTLAPDAGMVFLFDERQGPDDGFWMFRTRIPLDIAFFDEAGVIVAVRTMEPCESPNPQLCRSYAPGESYTGAIEMNRGWFGEHAVVVGDRIRVERRADRAARSPSGHDSM